MTDSVEANRNDELRDANSCMAMGAGLGVVGAGTALLAGATCPLCIVLAPALIGVGAWKRFVTSRRPGTESSVEDGRTNAAR